MVAKNGNVPKVLIITLIVLLFASCTYGVSQETLNFYGARISLEQRNLEENIFLLQGPWEFYWNQLWTPRSELIGEPEYLSPPESWTELHPAQGNASYRLTIEKPEELDELAFRIGSVFSAYEFYINGELVDSSGHVNENLDQARSQIRSVHNFTYRSNEPLLEVIVAVSNPHYRRNGLRNLRIGSPDLMEAYEDRKLEFYAMILGILLALCIYHVILAVQRKEQSYIIYFALFCFFIFWRFYIISSPLFLRHFPGVSFSLWDRLQRLGIYPLTGLFVSYISGLFPKESKKTILRVSQGASLFFSISAFLLPQNMVSGLAYQLFYPFIILALLYSAFVLIAALLSSREDVIPILIGFFLFFVTIILDILMDREILPWNINYTQEKGVILFIFFQAFAISRRLHRAFQNEKRLRQLLEGVQSRLELTVDGAQLGVIEWNIEQDQWIVNGNFFQLLGYQGSRRSINKDDWLDMIDKVDRKNISYQLEKLLDGQIQILRTEYKMRMKNGEYHWFLLIGRIIKRDALSKPQWFSGLNLDISDKKNNEEALSQLVKEKTKDLENSRREAEAANRAKSSFLANMSHEIRTPINGVSGMAEMLLGTKLNDDQKEYATVISRSSQALLSIINDILDFSKIESQKIELDASSINLLALTEDVLSLMENRAEEKGIELLFSFDPMVPPMVWGDETRIRQILTNLIGNAIKFTHQGYVLLEVHWLRGAKNDPGRYHFKIIDTGIGISPENQRKIFDDFIQADSTTSREYGGSGLGLSISRQLVELMGGTLELVSEVERGSEFSFDLALEVQNNQPNLVDQWSEDTQALKVVLAGGSDIQQSLLKKDLAHWDIPAKTLKNRLELSNTLDKASYSHLIILDKIANSQWLEWLERQGPNKRGLSVIGRIDLQDLVYQDNFKNSGIDGFLLNPISIRSLMDVLKGNTTTTYSPAGITGPLFGISAHILVAEDNRFNQRVVSAMLEKLGCSFDIAENGYEVLDKLRDNEADHFNLILMDCHMPLLDGYKTTGLVRLMEGPQRELPIIALTANAMKSDKQKCLDAGMDDYLAKPIHIKELSEKLKEFLSVEDQDYSEVSSNNSTLLDRQRLLELAGSRESMEEMLSLFVDSASRLMQKLDRSLYENREDTQELVHKLKGMAANAGAYDLSKKAMELEDAITEREDQEILLGHLFELKNKWEDLLNEISSY